MCLSTVDQIYDPPLEEERIGYKVMRLSCSVAQSAVARTSYELREWNTAMEIGSWALSPCSRTGILYFDEDGVKLGEYPFGFHCFRTLAEAVTYARRYGHSDVMRVRYRKTVASGTQHLSRVFSGDVAADLAVDVAQEMFIEGPVSVPASEISAITEKSACA